jgi:putative endonuclease
MRWLTEHGWRILDRNWRGSSGELDLVALDGNVLVAVEVKLRRGQALGTAEEAVSPAKAERLLRTVSEYLLAHPEHSDRLWRVDLIAVTLDARGRVARLTHLPNAVVSG